MGQPADESGAVLDDPYANLEQRMLAAGGTRYKPGMDYSNMAFARPYQTSGNPILGELQGWGQGPQEGWVMLDKAKYDEINPRSADVGAIEGFTKEFAPQFLQGPAIPLAGAAGAAAFGPAAAGAEVAEAGGAGAVGAEAGGAGAADVAGASRGLAAAETAAGGTLMPAAVPAADPTFGGALKDMGGGVFSAEAAGSGASRSLAAAPDGSAGEPTNAPDPAAADPAVIAAAPDVSAPATAGDFSAGGGFDESLMSDAMMQSLAAGGATGTSTALTTSGAGGDFSIGDGDIATGSGESGQVTTDAENDFLSGAAEAGAGGTVAKPTQSMMDKLLKYGPLPLLALGTLQQRQATKKAASSIGGLGGPQRDVGTQILNDFKNGTLNPADMAAIDEWKRGAIAQSRQYFAKAGTSDSTAALKAEQDINAKADAMAQQARQNLLTTGLNALNVTDKFQAAAIQAELQGDLQTANAAANFLNAYGGWLRALPQLTGGK